MYKLMYREDVRYVFNRHGVYYYTRRVPYDNGFYLIPHVIGKGFQVIGHAVPYTLGLPIHEETRAAAMGNEEGRQFRHSQVSPLIKNNIRNQ